MSRRGLGRGLSALIPDDFLDTAPGASREALCRVPLDQVRPNPEQPRTRFSAESLEALAESMRTHGIITPLLVQRGERGGYVLVAGERRLRAAGLAGLEEVPVIVREDLTTREHLELALVENLQREDLDPIETARAYQRLVDEFGLTQDEVARRVGKDRATVANAIRLLKLPDFALAALREGRITAGHGRALLACRDEATMRQALARVETEGLSVRATERLVASMQAPRPKRRASPVHERLSTALSRRLGTRVQVRDRGGRGRIVIEYHSQEDLDRLVERLS